MTNRLERPANNTISEMKHRYVVGKELTEKQMEFCKHLANGKAIYHAFRLVWGDAPAYDLPRKLSKHPLIQKEISAICEDYRQQMRYSREAHIAEINELQEKAEASGDHRLVLDCIKLKGVVCGHHQTQIKVEHTHSFNFEERLANFFESPTLTLDESKSLPVLDLNIEELKNGILHNHGE